MNGIRIITDKPIAIDSWDHVLPHGTANDNSSNPKFNKKLLALIAPSELSVIDLGCAGGGFVKSLIDADINAVGVEGSDYSQKIKRAEWGTIPDHLFTADITEPFRLVQTDADGQYQDMKFNLITAWEVLEHIKEDQLADVFKNINDHLTRDGMIILSVSATNKLRIYHQTVRHKKWWLKKMQTLGFPNNQTAVFYFGRDWVRGSFDTPRHFHFVLTRQDETRGLMKKMSALPLSAKIRITLMRSIWPLLSAETVLVMAITNKCLLLRDKIYHFIIKYEICRQLIAHIKNRLKYRRGQ